MSELKIITELDSSHDDKDGLPPIYSLGKARGFSKAVGMVKVNYQTHHRPWGYYEILAEGPGYLVKRITVDPGKRTSLQWHERRDEVWITVDGIGVFYIDGINKTTTEIPDMGLNQARVPEKSQHRITNEGYKPLVIIEVQTFDADNPSGEDDITRIEDDYNREVE